VEISYTQPTTRSTAFLEIDDISDSERNWGEVATLLLHPDLLAYTAKLAGNTITDNLLLAVDDRFGRQLPAPLVQFIVGQLGPDGTRPKPVDLLVRVTDEADEVITGRDEGNRISVHCGDILHPASRLVNSFLAFSVHWLDEGTEDVVLTGLTKLADIVFSLAQFVPEVICRLTATHTLVTSFGKCNATAKDNHGDIVFELFWGIHITRSSDIRQSHPH